jgi:hypothetical protein
VVKEGYVVYAKSKEYLNKFGCFGAIEIYKQLAEQVNSAIEYCISLRMPRNDFPIFGLLYYREEVFTGNIKRFETRSPGLRIILIE